MNKLVSVALIAVVCAACAGEGTDETTTTVPESTSTTGSQPGRLTTTTTRGEGIAVPQSVVEAALGVAVDDTGLDAADLTAVRAQQVVWSDSSLGCPEDGKAYLQVLTDGYLVVFDGPDGSYQYHSGMDLEFFRCFDPQEPAKTLVDR